VSARDPSGSSAEEPRFARGALLLLAMLCVTVVAGLALRALGPDDPVVWIPVSLCVGLAAAFLTKRLLPPR
jgi:hypothetical protein